MKDLNEVVSRKIDDLHNEIGDRYRQLEETVVSNGSAGEDACVDGKRGEGMKTVEVFCPFCGSKKMAGYLCPECGRMGGAILKVEDNSIWRIWHPISEHRDFNDALKAAGELFDGGMEEDFRIDDNPQPVSDWPGTLVPAYKLVKEECPECGGEVRSFDMVRTTDYHGIPYRRVCMKCYERIMETKGYDGEKYDERDENLDYDY